MPRILTINGGSSSIRFAVFSGEAPGLQRRLEGKIERLGTAEVAMSAGTMGRQQAVPMHQGGHGEPVDALVQWLDAQGATERLDAIGHRVVHGMSHSQPERVTAQLLHQLKGLVAYDPEHLPREIGLIEDFQRHFPQVPQVVCFDTAFHRNMPAVATMLAIPRRFQAQGVKRYGFHGLSYTFVLGQLGRLGDPAALRGRLIIAHLGSGASMVAVRDGQGVDTSMGFTPAAGLVMGTRAGDLDPGLMSFLAQSEGMSSAQWDAMVNHESGLKGVSETSADVRDLLQRESTDPRAAEALDLFCYQAKKWIGAYSAVLGGLDTLVFTGGIGENAPEVRRRICGEMEYLGIRLDAAMNERSGSRISAAGAAVTVRVIHTDEESVIAQLTAGLL